MVFFTGLKKNQRVRKSSADSKQTTAATSFTVFDTEVNMLP